MKSFILNLTVLGVSALLAGCPEQAESTTAPSQTPTAKWKFPKTLPTDATGEEIAYGKKLVAETVKHLGPLAPDPALRLAGNRMDCSSCHLSDGTQPGAAGFVGIAHRFPAYYAPLDREITLKERVQACFTRSLNGKELPERELSAFTAYLTWLSQDVPAGQVPIGAGLPELKMPNRAADLKQGAELYNYHCAACHGTKGEGSLMDDKQPGLGYSFPPVWGPDSFSQGSNMARLTIATRYIRSNMPLGRPVLRPEEAYDIAAYILSHPRPDYPGAGKDYPNPKTRPVDVPYGPYPDNWPAIQHKQGPFETETQP